MRKTLTAAMCCLAMGAAAQTITPEVMNEIRHSWQGNATDRALQNAVTANAINLLVSNHASKGEANMEFTYQVPTHGISNQKSSGRCWLFTGMNVLQNLTLDTQRAEGQEKPQSLELSHVYISFHDLLEKSNLFLQNIIDTRKLPMNDRLVDFLVKHPLNEGGTFTGVADMVEKYGLVPASVMPETYQSENSNAMLTYIKTVLRRSVSTLRRDPSKKVAVLKDVYRILVMCCGEPPQSFQWNGKTYTPHSFRNEVCPRAAELRDYVMLANDPLRPYYKIYDVALDRHSYEGHDWCHLNLPWEEMAEVAIASLRDTTAMYFSCDVGKRLDRNSGKLDLDNFDVEALLGVKLDMPKAEAIQTYESGSSHAMTLVGVAIENDKPVRWKIENSWGANNGANGHLVATDAWMKMYAYRLVVNKKYLSEKTRKLLGQKPVELPAWDYLY